MRALLLFGNQWALCGWERIIGWATVKREKEANLSWSTADRDVYHFSPSAVLLAWTLSLSLLFPFLATLEWRMTSPGEKLTCQPPAPPLPTSAFEMEIQAPRNLTTAVQSPSTSPCRPSTAATPLPPPALEYQVRPARTPCWIRRPDLCSQFPPHPHYPFEAVKGGPSKDSPRPPSAPPTSHLRPGPACSASKRTPRGPLRLPYLLSCIA